MTSDGVLKTRRSARVAPDINITPLVDVVLVLLIIFMVVAPQMEQDIPVTLPGIFNPDPDVEGQTAPAMVTMTKDGEFHLEAAKYDLDGVVAELNAVHSANPYKRLALRADAALTYSQVRDVFFRLQEVGFPGMSLMVSHRYQAGADDETGVPAVPADAAVGEPAARAAVPADGAEPADVSAPPAPGDAVPVASGS